MDTAATTTRDQLVQYAQTLIRKRGCNGFSYRDLADHVGVKTSSIHYYFPTKDDLLLEAIESYASASALRRSAIDASLPADQKLRLFIGSLEEKLRSGNLLCLGGALAADFECVPGPVQKAIAGFFLDNEKWLTQTFIEGLEQGTLRLIADPATSARVLFAALQGSTMTCRLFGDDSRVSEIYDVFAVANRATPEQ